MSTTDAAPKKNNSTSQNVSFLQSTNPEVFKVRPRAGGAFRNQACDLQQDDLPTLEDPNISKDFRVKSAIDDCISVSSQEASVANPLQDNKYVLGVIIGTIIALAADANATPKNYLKWLRRYLLNVKDEFGNHPPNTQSLLNYLETLGIDEEPASESSDDKTIKTTTRVSLEPNEEAEEAPPAEAAPEEEAA